MYGGANMLSFFTKNIVVHAAGTDPDLKLDFGKALLHRFQLFSKLVSLIYSCWLPQKIENAGLGLLQFF